jgi:hypothetical protein
MCKLTLIVLAVTVEATTLRAESKPSDEELILGVWEVVSFYGMRNKPVSYEFRKDGTVIVRWRDEPPTEGKYWWRSGLFDDDGRFVCVAITKKNAGTLSYHKVKSITTKELVFIDDKKEAVLKK